MNDQAMRFRLGIFVLASLLLLAVLITLFGGFPNYFKRSDEYTIVFSNAQGVTPGTPVRRSGVRIGEVRKVNLDDLSGKVSVVVQVDDGYRLRKSDRPTILQGILAGDTAIAFLPPADGKKVDNELVQTGATLVGLTQLDASDLIQRTSDLVPPAQESLNEIKKVFQKIDKLVPVIEETAKEFGNVARNIQELAPEIKKTNVEVHGLFKDARASLAKAEPAIQDFRDLAKELKAAANNINPAVKDAQDLIKEANKVVAKAGPAVDQLTNTAKEIEAFTAEVRKITPKVGPLIDETKIAIRQWTSIGERVDVLIKTNEDRIAKIIANVDDSVKKIAELMTDENQKNILAIIRNVRRSSDRFEGITLQVEDLLKDGKNSLAKVHGSLTKAEEFFENIQKASKPFADRSPAILKNLDQATNDLSKTITDLREILQTVARGDGTVQRLLSDPALYNNLNDTAIMANRLLPRVDRILRDVEVFADKIARHPESLGISGVVRPSSGLKDSQPQPWRLIQRPAYP